MQDLLSAIGNVGFPIAVASYLLMRLEKRMEKIEETSDKILTKTEEMAKTLERIERNTQK